MGSTVSTWLLLSSTSVREAKSPHITRYTTAPVFSKMVLPQQSHDQDEDMHERLDGNIDEQGLLDFLDNPEMHLDEWKWRNAGLGAAQHTEVTMRHITENLQGSDYDVDMTGWMCANSRLEQDIDSTGSTAPGLTFGSITDEGRVSPKPDIMLDLSQLITSSPMDADPPRDSSIIEQKDLADAKNGRSYGAGSGAISGPEPQVENEELSGLALWTDYIKTLGIGVGTPEYSEPPPSPSKNAQGAVMRSQLEHPAASISSAEELLLPLHRGDKNPISKGGVGLQGIHIVEYDLTKDRISLLDRVRLAVDYVLGGDVDWWPLPPPAVNRLQSPRQTKLCWQVSITGYMISSTMPYNRTVWRLRASNHFERRRNVSLQRKHPYPRWRAKYPAAVAAKYEYDQEQYEHQQFQSRVAEDTLGDALTMVENFQQQKCACCARPIGSGRRGAIGAIPVC